MKISNGVNKIIVALIIIFVLTLFFYQNYFKKEAPVFTLTEVVKGNIVQEVSETAQVKKGEKINLSFKLAGTIEKIYVEVGEKVKEGDALVKLDDGELKIQLKEAEANLELTYAKLNKLLAGASREEIQILKTAVDNAQVTLKTTQQNLNDVKAQSEENLKSDYDDALNILDDSELKINNALNFADLIKRTYFTKNDQEELQVRENKDKIESALNKVKPYLDSAKTTGKNEDVDTALSEMKKALNDASGALKIIREICETINYRSLISSADKTLIDTHRGNINTALTNIANSQQTISSTVLKNTANINTAQAKVDLAQGELKTAEDKLAQIIAPARKEDVDFYQAQIKQAEAECQLLEKQIKDTVLKSPIDGQVIKINKRKGEMIQPLLQDAVVTISPAAPFEIEVKVYEEEIVKIILGNPADISLVAFPKEIFKGKVVSIEPSEELIEGIVYYKVSIAFEKMPEGIKSGMTADVVIQTALKENVLIIPEGATQKKDDRTIAQVFKNGVIEEKEIEIGLLGTNGMVEVISGLAEGEKIITGFK